MEEQNKILITEESYLKAKKIVDAYENQQSQNKNAEAREFLIGIFNQMKVRVEKDCPNSVFYDVDGLGTVFKQDVEKKDLWVSNKHIWTVLESKYGYNYQQIQELITDMVEDTLNWRGYTPIIKWKMILSWWKTY